jgi:hypothetical protein
MSDVKSLSRRTAMRNLGVLGAGAVLGPGLTAARSWP